MKIEPKTVDGNADESVSELEDCFVRLIIDKLKDEPGINDKKELIERSPTFQVSIKNKRNLNENHYTLPLHNSGGVFVDTSTNICVECAKGPDDDFCCADCLSNLADVLPLNITGQEPEMDTKKSKSIEIRRNSYDSGFQNDASSPPSFHATSPGYDIQPSCSYETSYRKILPKPLDETKESTTRIIVLENKRSRRRSKTGKATELLRLKLDQQQKRRMCVEAVKRTDEEVFGVDKNNQTCLHKLLMQTNYAYIKEFFYALVEKMKRYPRKCNEIVAVERSVCEAIQEKDDSGLLLGYFQESLAQIRKHIENGSTQ